MAKKKLSKKAKILIISISSIVFIAVGLFITRLILDSKKNENQTYQVTKEKYENVIEIAGTISAAEEQTLQALSDGTVLGVYVQKGDKVKKGDLIIQLDDTEQKYNLAQLDNEITSVKISGSKKELELMMTKRTFLVQKVENRKVIATFDGIIADLNVAVGDYMEAKDSVGTLVNVDYLTAEVEIAETDVSNLKIGQKVTFSFPAYKDDSVQGYVVSWPAIGEVTSRGATVVNATIRIDNYPEQILPNFSFTGKIEITEPEEFLVVSTYAIGREEGKTFVQLASTKEKIPVTVRPYAKGYVKIVEGDIKGKEILKAQSSAPLSGSKRNQMGGMPGMNGKKPSGGMPGMGGGMPPRM